MSQLSHSLKTSSSHSQLKQQKVLDFASLTEEEKRQYISLIQKNNAKIEKDSNEDVLLAHFKVIRSKNPEKNHKQVLNSSQSSASIKASSPSKNRSITPDKTGTKEKTENRDKSPSNTTYVSRGRATNDIAINSSVKKKPTSKSPLRVENLRTVSPVVQRVKLENVNEAIYENPSANTQMARESTGSQKRLDTSCSERLGTDPSNSKRSRSPISEGTKECCTYYKDLCNLMNLSDNLGYIRPKKYSYESLNKIIEEIFSARFASGTKTQPNFLYSKTSHASLRSNQPFYIFVFDYFKIKAKHNTEPLEQSVLNFVYSVYWFKKKIPEVELLSRFLTGESDDDELAFFLLMRFYAEKEMNLILCNWHSCTGGIMISLRSCYRVLEMVYGADQKDFIFRVIQRIKDFIADEREKKHDFGLEGTSIYSFLSIGLETYCITKADEDVSESFNVDTINETTAENEESYSEATSDKMPWNSPQNQDIQEFHSQRTSLAQRNNSGFSTIEKLPSNPNSILLGMNDKQFRTEDNRSKRTTPENPSYQNTKQYKQEDKPFSLLTGLRSSFRGQQVSAPVPSKSNSPHRMRKPTPNSKDEGCLDELQAVCLKIMLEKIDEFIEVTLFRGKNLKESLKEAIQIKLLRIFTKKFVTLIKALFSFDKMKWFDALIIEDPGTSQIQNIEDLQKDLRRIKKKRLDELNNKDLTLFINKILRTPELSAHIGKLILEFESCKIA